MKKKLIVIILSTFCIIVIMLIIKYYNLKHSNKVPYKNLTQFSSNSYFIYFDIIYNDQTYTVVYGNTEFCNLLLPRRLLFLTPLYSLWLSEKIKHNWSIAVNDRIFDKLKYGIVKKEYVSKHMKKLTMNKVLEKGKLPGGIDVRDFNAIVYILLKNEVNCMTICETGNTEIIIPRHMIKKVEWEDFLRENPEL